MLTMYIFYVYQWVKVQITHTFETLSVKPLQILYTTGDTKNIQNKHSAYDLSSVR